MPKSIVEISHHPARFGAILALAIAVAMLALFAGRMNVGAVHNEGLLELDGDVVLELRVAPPGRVGGAVLRLGAVAVASDVDHGVTRLDPLAELGDPTNLTTFGVDLTVEATGYLAANSPLAVGSSWAAVTVLPGLRFGNPGGSQFTLMIGPTFFFGHASDTRALLALRFDTPLVRRRPQP